VRQFDKCEFEGWSELPTPTHTFKPNWLDTNHTTFYITCTKIPSTVSIKGRAQPKFVSEREKLLKLKQTRTSEEINEQITNRESQFKAEVNFS
jgi:hypothetical protein